MKKLLIVILLLIPSTVDARCKRRDRNQKCYVQTCVPTYHTPVKNLTLDVKLKTESGTVIPGIPELPKIEVVPQIQEITSEAPQNTEPIVEITPIPDTKLPVQVVPEPIVEPIVEPVVEPTIPVIDENLVPAPAPLFIEFN
jgi:hypothetical protein